MENERSVCWFSRKQLNIEPSLGRSRSQVDSYDGPSLGRSRSQVDSYDGDDDMTFDEVERICDEGRLLEGDEGMFLEGDEGRFLEGDHPICHFCLFLS